MATTAFSDSEVRKASFAEVASANRYCRPDVSEGTSSSQVADFVFNDVVLNEEPHQQQHERQHICGRQRLLSFSFRSFVPADHAKELLIAYGVGAYDDLSTGSSFMMEMSEAAN